MTRTPASRQDSDAGILAAILVFAGLFFGGVVGGILAIVRGNLWLGIPILTVGALIWLVSLWAMRTDHKEES